MLKSEEHESAETVVDVDVDVGVVDAYEDAMMIGGRGVGSSRHTRAGRPPGA